jgi:hypothetical protein
MFAAKAAASNAVTEAIARTDEDAPAQPPHDLLERLQRHKNAAQGAQ